MTQGFFLNQTLIQEILIWRSNSAENLLVFEPIARACNCLGSLLLPDDPARAAEISGILEAWCAGAEFEQLLCQAGNTKSSISLELARKTLSRFSGSDSFVAGLPIDQVLCGFSALIRADLRSRESRSVARIDELFLWQACFKRLSLHDLCLLALSALASKNIMSTFDRLLAIKEAPGTLTQIESESLSCELSAQFTSGMRLFALANFEAAETAWEQAIDRDPQSPSVYLAMSLLQIMRGKADEARSLLARAQSKSDSCLPESISHLIDILFRQEAPEIRANDPISTAIACFFLLRGRQYERVKAIAEKHLQNFPCDLLMQNLAIEAVFAPVREELYNDPPLPGGLNHGHAGKLSDARTRLSALAEFCESMNFASLKRRASTNLSCLALMARDFQAAAACAGHTLESTPGCGEARINLAITMLAKGDLPETLRCLNGLPPEFKLTGMRLAAEAQYHACSFETALDLWKRILQDEEDRLWQLRTLCRMLEVYRLLQDSKNAQSCVDTMLAEFQHEPETLFALGYELWQMGRTDDAVHALQRAKDLAAPNLRQWIAWELGRVLFDCRKTLAATDEYVSISDRGSDSVQAREFAVTLFRSGLLPAAYERARAIRQVKGEVVPGITEIEADYLVRNQKFAEARDLLSALCRKRPLSVLNRLAVARICASLNDAEAARQELSAIRGLCLSSQMQKEVDRFSKDLEMLIAARGK